MNARHQEKFQNALIGQYRELIQEAIYESETDHKTRVDLGKLNAKLQMITKAALKDGLGQQEINQLIDQATQTQLPMAA